MSVAYLRVLLKGLLTQYLERVGSNLELDGVEALRAVIDATLVQLDRYLRFSAPGYDS